MQSTREKQNEKGVFELIRRHYALSFQIANKFASINPKTGRHMN